MSSLVDPTRWVGKDGNTRTVQWSGETGVELSASTRLVVNSPEPRRFPRVYNGRREVGGFYEGHRSEGRTFQWFRLL